MDYCDSEQAIENTKYDLLHRTFSKYVFLEHVNKSIIGYVTTIAMLDTLYALVIITWNELFMECLYVEQM